MKPTHSQQLLEVEDLCEAAKPDERSVMTYVASFFHAFSSQGEHSTFYILVLTLPTQIRRRQFLAALSSLLS